MFNTMLLRQRGWLLSTASCLLALMTLGCNSRENSDAPPANQEAPPPLVNVKVDVNELAQQAVIEQIKIDLSKKQLRQVLKDLGSIQSVIGSIQPRSEHEFETPFTTDLRKAGSVVLYRETVLRAMNASDKVWAVLQLSSRGVLSLSTEGMLREQSGKLSVNDFLPWVFEPEFHESSLPKQIQLLGSATKTEAAEIRTALQRRGIRTPVHWSIRVRD